MKKKGNCFEIGVDWWECPFLARPRYKSGFTGKEGPETWWSCDQHRRYIRDIKRCSLAGDPKEQREIAEA